MTERDKLQISEYYARSINAEVFLMSISFDIITGKELLRTLLSDAIDTADANKIELTLELIWKTGNVPGYVDILNELLINCHHYCHQQIAKQLQDSAPDNSTVAYVRKALESNFEYLAYTCSESGTIAKWFSWLLFAIGTSEAIALMKEYSMYNDEGIREEMLYRLSKISTE